jgi:hypothetical protein
MQANCQHLSLLSILSRHAGFLNQPNQIVILEPAFNGQLIRLIRAAKQRPQSLCIAIKAFFHAPIPHCSFTGFWRGQGWAIPMGSVMVNAGPSGI